MAGTNHYTAFVATTSSALIADAAAVLYEVAGQNTGGIALWLQVFDKASAPQVGDVPVYTYLVQDGQTYAIKPPSPPGDNGRRMVLGIAIGWSHNQEDYAPTEVPGQGGTIFVGWREATNTP